MFLGFNENFQKENFNKKNSFETSSFEMKSQVNQVCSKV